MLGALAKQLIHDMKASWQKTLVLGLLLVVGLFFWVPPLVRAVVGRPATTAKTSQAAAPTTLAPIETETTFQESPKNAQTAAAAYDWQNADELLSTDPLVRSAEAAAIQGNPFQIDWDQFPPPILFAEESDDRLTSGIAKPATPPPSGLSPPATPEGLILKSTIVGVSRRAAFINSRLYHEGKNVRTKDGQSYLISAIFPRKVVLIRDNEAYELRIPQPHESQDIGIRRGPSE